MTYVTGSHHVTLSVGHAQEDVDFHTKVLGMRFIKKTVLYDGSTPIYHLYYSNANGDPSSVVTTFPWAQAGVYGKRGTNQAREVFLSVPSDSLDYWDKRLGQHDIETQMTEVFGERRVNFRHPSGLEYVMVGNEADPREGFTGNGVSAEHAVHGIHGTGVHVYDQDRMVEFARDVFQAKGNIQEEGDRVRFQVGDDKFGNYVELTGNRTDEQGTWHYGAGTYHHFAWNLDTLENQNAIKFEIEGAGYTDISELKNRTYFKSHYVRTPGGALFELAVTHNEGGWDCDESPEELGQAFMLPPQFEDQRQSIMDQLEPIQD
ncbi:Chlorohydroquinone/hydroquinone 1,2-dioxygenase [Arthrobacter ulcerisalmonis]|uniref:Chlorohydroquinone/hydroquinone 1,2-dioxygenase n=1 Tax=Arthrobacter ulcerisalmonis TaxID=2483813 RepID=A0A3P5WF65_9MICC|nr:VOC family protein [Arthrobacter ulcerisalmonis]VDC18507.1 Chlorohydroquinone/hydroquinone 1,2-dioxygenase [Arthrobacter ulcerisalmonis]